MPHSTGSIEVATEYQRPSAPHCSLYIVSMPRHLAIAETQPCGARSPAAAFTGSSEYASNCAGVTPSRMRISMGTSTELMAGSTSITDMSTLISKMGSFGATICTLVAWIRPWLEIVILVVEVCPGNTSGSSIGVAVITGSGTSVSKVDSSVIL